MVLCCCSEIKFPLLSLNPCFNSLHLSPLFVAVSREAFNPHTCRPEQGHPPESDSILLLPPSSAHSCSCKQSPGTGEHEEPVAQRRLHPKRDGPEEATVGCRGDRHLPPAHLHVVFEHAVAPDALRARHKEGASEGDQVRPHPSTLDISLGKPLAVWNRANQEPERSHDANPGDFVSP